MLPSLSWSGERILSGTHAGETRLCIQPGIFGLVVEPDPMAVNLVLIRQQITHGPPGFGCVESAQFCGPPSAPSSSGIFHSTSQAPLATGVLTD